MGNSTSRQPSPSTSRSSSPNPNSTSASPRSRSLSSSRPSSGIYNSLNSYLQSDNSSGENLFSSNQSSTIYSPPFSRYTSPYRSNLPSPPPPISSPSSRFSPPLTSVRSTPILIEIKSILLELCQILDSLTHDHIPNLEQSSIVRKLLRRISVLIKLDNDSFYEKFRMKLTKDVLNAYLFLKDDEIEADGRDRRIGEKNKIQINKGKAIIKGRNFSRPLPSPPSHHSLKKDENVKEGREGELKGEEENNQRINIVNNLMIKNQSENKYRQESEGEILIDKYKEKDKEEKEEQLPNLFPIVTEEIIMELSIRAMNDNPRGILPLILTFFSTILRSIQYSSAVLSSSSVFLPLKKLLFIAAQYNLILNEDEGKLQKNYGNSSSFLGEPHLEEELFTNSLKRNVDVSLLILLKTLWMKFREDRRVIKYYLSGKKFLNSSSNLLSSGITSFPTFPFKSSTSSPPASTNQLEEKEDEDIVNVLSILIPFLFNNQELLASEAQQTILIILSIKNYNFYEEEKDEYLPPSSFNPIDYFFLHNSQFSQGIIGDLCSKFAEAVEEVQGKMIQEETGEEDDEESDVEIEEIEEIEDETFCEDFYENINEGSDEDIYEDDFELDGEEEKEYNFFQDRGTEIENKTSNISEVTKLIVEKEEYDDDFLFDFNEENDYPGEEKDLSKEPKNKIENEIERIKREAEDLDLETYSMEEEDKLNKILQKKWKEFNFEETHGTEFEDYITESNQEVRTEIFEDEDWDKELEIEEGTGRKNEIKKSINKENKKEIEKGKETNTKTYSLNYFATIFSLSKRNDQNGKYNGKENIDCDKEPYKEIEEKKGEQKKELIKLFHNKIKLNEENEKRKRISNDFNIKSSRDQQDARENDRVRETEKEELVRKTKNLNWLPPYLQKLIKVSNKKIFCYHKNIIKEFMRMKITANTFSSCFSPTSINSSISSTLSSLSLSSPESNFPSSSLSSSTSSTSRYSLSRYIINSSLTSSSSSFPSSSLSHLFSFPSSSTSSTSLSKFWNSISFFLQIFETLFDTEQPEECFNYLLDRIKDDYIELPEFIRKEYKKKVEHKKKKKLIKRQKLSTLPSTSSTTSPLKHIKSNSIPVLKNSFSPSENTISASTSISTIHIYFPPRIILAVRLLNYFNKWFLSGVLRASLHKSVSPESRTSSYALLDIILTKISNRRSENMKKLYLEKEKIKCNEKIEDKKLEGKLCKNLLDISSILLYKILKIFFIPSPSNLYLLPSENCIESLYLYQPKNSSFLSAISLPFIHSNYPSFSSSSTSSSTSFSTSSPNIISSSLFEALNSSHLPLSVYSIKLVSKYFNLINTSSFLYQFLNIKPFISTFELKKVSFILQEILPFQFLCNNIYKDSEEEMNKLIEDESEMESKETERKERILASDILFKRIDQLYLSNDIFLLKKKNFISEVRGQTSPSSHNSGTFSASSFLFINQTENDLWRLLNLIRFFIDSFQRLHLLQQINLTDLIQNIFCYLLSNLVITYQKHPEDKDKKNEESNREIEEESDRENEELFFHLLKQKLLLHLYSFYTIVKTKIKKINEKNEEKLFKESNHNERKFYLKCKKYLRSYLLYESMQYLASEKKDELKLEIERDLEDEKERVCEEKKKNFFQFSFQFYSVILLEDLLKELHFLISSAISMIKDEKNKQKKKESTFPLFFPPRHVKKNLEDSDTFTNIIKNKAEKIKETLEGFKLPQEEYENELNIILKEIEKI